MDIIKTLSEELNIKISQTQSAVGLIDEGNTIPFIARYRKEATGGLDDETLRTLDTRLEALRSLEQSRANVERLISEQGKMTDEIAESLRQAKTVTEIEDIYRPYRPKRRTRASIAAERGLAPLAELMLQQDPKVNIETEAQTYVDGEKGVGTAKEALAGAMDIIAEQVSDNAEYRKWIRDYTSEKGTVVSKTKTDEDTVYSAYYSFSEPVKKIPSHRILAINRGEREGVLGVKTSVDEAWVCNYLKARVCSKLPSSSRIYVIDAVEDAYKRLIAPSVQTEVRGIMTDMAQEQAIKVFGENLKSLLLQPPVRGKVVMGFDPAYRTGCKIAVVDDLGNILDTTVVYPTPPQNKTAEAEKTLTGLIEKHKVDIISIGNGTASKESEIFVAELIKKQKREVSYIMTSEAGASVYSASKLASDELPQYDVSLRSAVSIARRLQDPLAELVKIDPKAIGVGQYQHDMEPKQLNSSLGGVVESAVSSVGVDLNTASPALLSHVAGINAKTAQSIYEHRTTNTRFTKRSDLKKVKGIGEKAYTQCAGFLRVPDSPEVLDNTAVHPESYEAAKKLLSHIGISAKDIKEHKKAELDERLNAAATGEVAEAIGIGLPTLTDIIAELKKPGRDPRDELPKPQLRSDVMDINSLQKGMELVGTVRNVADFGAFVDIGVHQDGLIHISKLTKGYCKRALDAVSIGDILTVRVIDVDTARNRISLERVFDD